MFQYFDDHDLLSAQSMNLTKIFTQKQKLPSHHKLSIYLPQLKSPKKPPRKSLIPKQSPRKRKINQKTNSLPIVPSVVTFPVQHSDEIYPFKSFLKPRNRKYKKFLPKKLSQIQLGPPQKLCEIQTQKSPFLHPQFPKQKQRLSYLKVLNSNYKPQKLHKSKQNWSTSPIRSSFNSLNRLQKIFDKKLDRPLKINTSYREACLQRLPRLHLMQWPKELLWPVCRTSLEG